MEERNKVERTDIWNNIYKVLARLDLKKVEGDCLDRSSAATEIEMVMQEHIDKLEAENIKLKESKSIHIRSRIILSDEVAELEEKIKRVEDSLMSDEEIETKSKVYQSGGMFYYDTDMKRKLTFQRDLTLKALEG